MPIIDDKVQDQIRYGHTNDLSRMPTVYSRSYDEAVRYAKNDQPANRPFYIIELCEHYEVCDIIDNKWDEYLCLYSMPKDASTHIFIKRGRAEDAE